MEQPPQVGDIFEYRDHFGLIIYSKRDLQELDHWDIRANWYIPHPDLMFRHAHPDADWYVPKDHWTKFKIVGHVDETVLDKFRAV